eukprot:TRINITY_DN3266_c0_g1_i1.p1 TRINITY_DN3266_c0_g1~~TRINITY_DN3266_c0_g1_i1.p1  ORF type:complete len:335 (+),score=99.87 TRINITY_DN3266_c0_g1_i1:95-1099(+)
MSGGWAIDPVWVCVVGAPDTLLQYFVGLGAVLSRGAVEASVVAAQLAEEGQAAWAVRRVVVATCKEGLGAATATSTWKASHHTPPGEVVSDPSDGATLVEVVGGGKPGAAFAPLPWWVELHRRVYNKSPRAELVTVCDPKNAVVGACYRDQLRARTLYHRSSYIIVELLQDKRSKAPYAPPRYFVQKRTATKDYMPSRWDPAPGGTVAAGESVYENAAREIVEEMGIVPDNHPDKTHQGWGTPATALPLAHVVDLSFHTAANRVHGGVYVCRTWLKQEGLELQPEEVAEVRVMTAEEVARLAPSAALPDGVEAFQRALAFLASRHAPGAAKPRL